MALLGSLVKRLPLTSSMIYLLIGVLLGPLAAGVVRIEPLESANSLEHLAELLGELAVIVSLFTAALKLRTPLSDVLWRVPVRLATLSMMLTVGLIAAAGVYGLGLSWGRLFFSAQCWHRPIRCWHQTFRWNTRATLTDCDSASPGRPHERWHSVSLRHAGALADEPARA
jgi:hypothetical protein